MTTVPWLLLHYVQVMGPGNVSGSPIRPKASTLHIHCFRAVHSSQDSHLTQVSPSTQMTAYFLFHPEILFTGVSGSLFLWAHSFGITQGLNFTHSSHTKKDGLELSILVNVSVEKRYTFKKWAFLCFLLLQRAYANASILLLPCQSQLV